MIIGFWTISLSRADRKMSFENFAANPWALLIVFGEKPPDAKALRG